MRTAPTVRRPIIERGLGTPRRDQRRDAAPQVREAVEHVLADIDAGPAARGRAQGGGQWTMHQWMKKAVLLSFRLEDNQIMRGRRHSASSTRCRPSSPTWTSRDCAPRRRTRGAAGGGAPRAASSRRNVVLMPSYVNIGAYVDEGTMVDTWATVGSCAQIGKNVHLSGGVGIGGVLEPLQANPDHHRGQLLHRRALGGRRGRDRRGGLGDLDGRVHRPEHQDLRPRHRRGELRPRARGLGGRAAAACPRRDGTYSLYCAVIVKKVDAQTRGEDQHQRTAARLSVLRSGRRLARARGLRNITLEVAMAETMERVLRLMAEQPAPQTSTCRPTRPSSSRSTARWCSRQSSCVSAAADAPAAGRGARRSSLEELRAHRASSTWACSVAGVGQLSHLRPSASAARSAAVIRLHPGRHPDARALSACRRCLRELIMEKRGLMLMVGATGTGKSTTLASMHRVPQPAR
jgi:2,3,4,5-tetrahydropyridine-2-carboxylate N-succinyltransferase